MSERSPTDSFYLICPDVGAAIQKGSLAGRSHDVIRGDLDKDFSGWRSRIMKVVSVGTPPEMTLPLVEVPDMDAGETRDLRVLLFEHRPMPFKAERDVVLYVHFAPPEAERPIAAVLWKVPESLLQGDAERTIANVTKFWSGLWRVRRTTAFLQLHRIVETSVIAKDGAYAQSERTPAVYGLLETAARGLTRSLLEGEERAPARVIAGVVERQP